MNVGTWRRAQQKQVYMDLGMNLLQKILTVLFGNSSFNNIVEAKPDINFFMKINEVCKKEFAREGWAQEKNVQVLKFMHRILKQANASSAVIKSFQLPCNVKKEFNVVLGQKYGDIHHPLRQMLENWIALIRANSTVKSDMSMRNVFSFYMCSLFPKLNINLDDWCVKFEEYKQTILTKCADQETLQNICASTSDLTSNKKACWLKLFINYVLREEVHLPILKSRHQVVEVDNEDEDVHRISKSDLEKLHNVAVKDVQNEMMFMMLLTTGMRIGGYSRLKTRDVAEVQNGKWVARTEGRTVEKGQKLFTFKLHTRVQELVGIWLNKKRGFDNSEYMFPSIRGSHLKTWYFRKRFKDMCKEAQLKGCQFHPHALRHCYAHILFTLGNTAETISKLINHADVAVTKKHYLKETAVDICDRAIIPWFEANKEKKDPVPKFLIGASLSTTDKRKRDDALNVAKSTIAKLAKFK